MAEWVVVDGKRYDLEVCKDLAISTGEERGVKVTGVYVTPSGKLIVGTFSIWERPGSGGQPIGQGYHFAEAAEVAELASRFGTAELVEMVPEGS